MNPIHFTTRLAVNALKRKKLDGRTYLVGPVIMAKECVMNGILYKAADLRKSVPSWNGRIVTENHPKDDVTFISANESPTIYEQWGLGLLFNTTFNDKTTKLRSEAWLDEDKLKANKALQEKIDAGETLEVSTGLIIDYVEEEGEFNGKKYSKVATNLRPDHLALLPEDTGACSVDDGAGFPRANISIAVNSVIATNLADGELRVEVFKALRAWDKEANKGFRKFPYVEELLDNNMCIFSAYGEETMNLYRIGINTTTTPVSLVGDPIEVVRRVSYVDVPSTSLQTNTKGLQMDKKTIIDGLIAANQAQEADRERLMALNEADFTSEVDKLKAPKTPKTETPPVVPNVETPAPVKTNVQKDQDAMAATLYTNARNAVIAKIKANKENTFTDEDLSDMTLNHLEKVGKLATAQRGSDFSANGAGGLPTAAQGAKKLPTPYVADTK